MPGYATPANMVALYSEAALVQLVDAVEWNAAAQERVSWAIGRASTRADTYLAKIYAAGGATSIPPFVTDTVCTIAFYHLHTDPPKKVVDDYNQALRDLADIGTGKLKIDEGNVDAIPARPGAVLVSGPTRIFDRDSLRGF